ncbi:hypothetical protein D7Y13_26210 [Corallococcus praedator]|uniref:CENP-V/GFA domain-containing protein n=1 Tax=Corallococcus praedator TaxID=2316724 RepID=A0ABX9QBZ4_9BACT|nr:MULTISPECIES: GFA family protein [Corallococcus]RKH24500.1 hypothetical protein D7X75_31860 [Corallococcus sp. CA031C]RKI00847.1 hypothetical protein D7Y13_26210 [Corallococcus praedator]
MSVEGPERFTGGCLCGSVRIVASGRPCRVGVCHCLDCRKHHGALFHASAIFPQDAHTRSEKAVLTVEVAAATSSGDAQKARRAHRVADMSCRYSLALPSSRAHRLGRVGGALGSPTLLCSHLPKNHGVEAVASRRTTSSSMPAVASRRSTGVTGKI